MKGITMLAKNREFIIRDLNNLDLDLEDIMLRNGVTHAQVRNAAFEGNVNLNTRRSIRTSMKSIEKLQAQIAKLNEEIEDTTKHLHCSQYSHVCAV